MSSELEYDEMVTALHTAMGKMGVADGEDAFKLGLDRMAGRLLPFLSAAKHTVDSHLSGINGMYRPSPVLMDDIADAVIVWFFAGVCLGGEYPHLVPPPDEDASDVENGTAALRLLRDGVDWDDNGEEGAAK